jgi:hypothetical protein
MFLFFWTFSSQYVFASRREGPHLQILEQCFPYVIPSQCGLQEKAKFNIVEQTTGLTGLLLKHFHLVSGWTELVLPLRSSLCFDALATLTFSDPQILTVCS